MSAPPITETELHQQIWRDSREDGPSYIGSTIRAFSQAIEWTWPHPGNPGSRYVLRRVELWPDGWRVWINDEEMKHFKAARDRTPG